MQEEYKRAIRTFVANSTPTADKEKIINFIRSKTGYVLPPVSVKPPKNLVRTIDNVRSLSRVHAAREKIYYEKATQCCVIKLTQPDKHITTFNYQHILSKEPISPEKYATILYQVHTIRKRVTSLPKATPPPAPMQQPPMQQPPMQQPPMQQQRQRQRQCKIC